jgi:hypothetical protein
VNDAARIRRLHRLRDELHDEGIPLAIDSPKAVTLLEELDYARRPPTHEGISPRFGALLVHGRQIADGSLTLPGAIVPTSVDAAVIRRMADGRSSFIARFDDGHALVSLDHTIEHEATAVRLAVDADVTVVQRQPTGWVRVFGQRGVISWDGSRWWAKPLAEQLAATIRESVELDLPTVLDSITELCVHWLSPNRVGAVLVWEVGRPANADEHFGHAASLDILPVDLSQRVHFSALLNVLAQTDRAAIVERSGVVRRIGVALRPSAASSSKVTPYRGTRHTSALRLSHDEPDTLVFTVSSSGSVTVMHAGQIVSVASST